MSIKLKGNNTPIVSICVTSYNQVKYIEQCIQSILAQVTKYQFNIVVADDHSTDGTSEILKRYKNNFSSRFKLLLQNRNKGAAANWIDCFNASDGNYIALMDGDDYWTDKYKIQKMTDFLIKNPNFSGCFHKAYTTNEGSSTSQKETLHYYDKLIFSFEDTISRKILTQTSTFMFAKSKFFVPPWFNKIHAGDRAIFSIVASHGPLFLFDDYMGHYRKHPNNITSHSSLKIANKNKRYLFIQLKKQFPNRAEKQFEQILKKDRYKFLQKVRGKLFFLSRKIISLFARPHSYIIIATFIFRY